MQIILKELSFIENCKATLSNERLILFYKLSDEMSNKSFTEKIMKHTLRKFFPSFYQPDYLVKVDLFPLNDHGKFKFYYNILIFEGRHESNPYIATNLHFFFFFFFFFISLGSSD